MAYRPGAIVVAIADEVVASVTGYDDVGTTPVAVTYVSITLFEILFILLIYKTSQRDLKQDTLRQCHL